MLTYKAESYCKIILDIFIYCPMVIQNIKQKYNAKYFGTLPLIYIFEEEKIYKFKSNYQILF